jgi:hypothetical protein
MLHHNHQSLNAAPQPSIYKCCTKTINLLMLHHNHQSLNAAPHPSICECCTKTINLLMLHHNHQLLVNAAPQLSTNSIKTINDSIKNATPQQSLMLYHNHQSVNAVPQPSICKKTLQHNCQLTSLKQSMTR